MKKLLWVVMSLILIIGMLSGCAATGNTEESQATDAVESTQAQTEGTEAVAEDAVKDKLDEVKEKGVLVLGVSADYPPYEFHKEIEGKDTIVGFDIDIANKLAESMGVELEIVDMKFEGLLPALTAGKIDLIVSGMTPTEERKQTVDFSIVYYDPMQTMLVKSDAKDVLSTVESFDGKNIGVQKSTVQEDTAKAVFANSNVKALDKIPNLIMELKTGKVDGLVLVAPVAKSYAKANDDLDLNGLDLGSEGGVAIAVQKDTGKFLELIDETLQGLLDSGEMDEFITEATLLSESE